jgi:hypothetical protein
MTATMCHCAVNLQSVMANLFIDYVTFGDASKKLFKISLWQKHGKELYYPHSFSFCPTSTVNERSKAHSDSRREHRQQCPKEAGTFLLLTRAVHSLVHRLFNNFDLKRPP